MAADNNQSLFGLMQKNARLRKNMQKAKTTQAAREFSGPDGDYPCVFKRFASYEKDNTPCVIFEFRTTEDAGEFANEKIVKFFRLADGPIRTAEEEQALLFETIQLMGVDTDQDEKNIETDLNNLAVTETVIDVRVKTTESKKDKKKYKNFDVVGVAAEGQKEAEYTNEEAPIEPEETATDEEWNEEETAEEAEVVPEDSTDDEWGEEEPEEAEEESFPPSAYIGYDCVYKGKECSIENADDETGTVVVKDKKTGKKLANVKFENLDWPA